MKIMKIINSRKAQQICLMILALISVVYIGFFLCNIDWDECTQYLQNIAILLFILIYCWSQYRGIKEKITKRDAENAEIIASKEKSNYEKSQQLKFYSTASIFAETLRSQSALIVLFISNAFLIAQGISNNIIVYRINIAISIILIAFVLASVFFRLSKYNCIVVSNTPKCRQMKINELLNQSV